MENSQPNNPARTVEIQSEALRRQVEAVTNIARRLGFWDAPYAEAATTVEEMDEIDIFYWVHKAANPITQVDDEAASLLATDGPIAGLPDGFEKQHAVTMSAAGDMLCVQESPARYSNGVLFENVADLLFGQTISFATFESSITTQPLKREIVSEVEAPVQCCSKAQFEAFKGHGETNFTALNLAHNHTCDFGVEGIETTQQVVTGHGITGIGVNSSPDEHGRATIISKDGLKIGFASATFGLNGRTLPDDDRYRVHVARLCSNVVLPELDLVKQQIDDCKAQNCDFIIASLHWGWEFELFPRQSQIETAHALVEYGADAILGGHPHVIQPVEYYRTKRDPSRIAVIAYSLGTLTWGFSAPYLVLSLILNLTLAKGRIEGRDVTYIEAATETPVFRSGTLSEGAIETKIEKLVDHCGGRSTRHSKTYMDDIERYADLVLGKGWRA